MKLPSPVPPADPARELSKLIAALERQWQEELGGPEATATANVMRKAHRLLTEITGGKPTGLTGGQRLRTELGAEWLEANPWAARHVAKIDAALNDLPLRN